LLLECGGNIKVLLFLLRNIILDLEAATDELKLSSTEQRKKAQISFQLIRKKSLERFLTDDMPLSPSQKIQVGFDLIFMRLSKKGTSVSHHDSERARVIIMPNLFFSKTMSVFSLSISLFTCLHGLIGWKKPALQKGQKWPF